MWCVGCGVRRSEAGVVLTVVGGYVRVAGVRGGVGRVVARGLLQRARGRSAHRRRVAQSRQGLTGRRRGPAHTYLKSQPT